MPSLARLQAEQTPLYKQTELFNKCLTKVIFPAGNTKLQDGSSTTGVEDYKEFWYSLVGLNSIGQSFDGNGPMAKFLVGNSGQTLRSQPTCILGTQLKGTRLLARSPQTPLGTRPATRPQSRRTSRSCPATSRRCPTSTARSPKAPRTGADDERRATATKAGSASATRSSATARRSSRWSRWS